MTGKFTRPLLAAVAGVVLAAVAACNSPTPPPPPPPAPTPPSPTASQGSLTSLVSMMPSGTTTCQNALTYPAWFSGDAPNRGVNCDISPGGDNDTLTAYQWDSAPSDPGTYLNAIAAGDAGDFSPTSVTQADSFGSCPAELPVGSGCQFSWSGSNGSGQGLYFQAGYGTEDLTWTDPADGTAVEIFDQSGGNSIADAQLQLETWFLQNVQGM